MSFKIRPPALVVPEDNPFKNDQLERKEPVEALARLVRTVSGPCVVAVDAGWGMGKTTFLDMCSAHLKGNGTPVAMFNAWETDFANEPFLALSEELAAALMSNVDHDTNRFDPTTAQELRRRIAKVRATAGLALLKAFLASAVGNNLADAVVEAANAWTNGEDGDSSRYGEAQAAINDFRNTLQRLASEHPSRQPTVVIVDELDRCRPSYAVELLETVKHLFSVECIIFILGINRSQLETSIRSLYGADFDASVYLRRFIDIEFRLPQAARQSFIDWNMDEIEQQLGGNDWRARDCWSSMPRKWLEEFFGNQKPDLRTVQQALQRLGLVIAMLDERDDNETHLMATIAIILRTLEPELYDRLEAGTATDDEVINSLFEWASEEFWYRSDDAENFVLRLIGAAWGNQSTGEHSSSVESPFVSQCRSMTKKSTSRSNETLYVCHNSSSVISYMVQHNTIEKMLEWRRKYERASRLLELVSYDFDNQRMD